jgi:hypothetical protein
MSNTSLGFYILIHIYPIRTQYLLIPYLYDLDTVISPIVLNHLKAICLLHFVVITMIQDYDITGLVSY